MIAISFASHFLRNHNNQLASSVEYGKFEFTRSHLFALKVLAHIDKSRSFIAFLAAQKKVNWP